MKITESTYKQLCGKCVYLRKAGNRRICTYGVGCAKQDKVNEIKKA